MRRVREDSINEDLINYISRNYVTFPNDRFYIGLDADALQNAINKGHKFYGIKANFTGLNNGIDIDEVIIAYNKTIGVTALETNIKVSSKAIPKEIDKRAEAIWKDKDFQKALKGGNFELAQKEQEKILKNIDNINIKNNVVKGINWFANLSKRMSDRLVHYHKADGTYNGLLKANNWFTRIVANTFSFALSAVSFGVVSPSMQANNKILRGILNFTRFVAPIALIAGLSLIPGANVVLWSIAAVGFTFGVTPRFIRSIMTRYKSGKKESEVEVNNTNLKNGKQKELSKEGESKLDLHKLDSHKPSARLSESSKVMPEESKNNEKLQSITYKEADFASNDDFFNALKAIATELTSISHTDNPIVQCTENNNSIGITKITQNKDDGAITVEFKSKTQLNEGQLKSIITNEFREITELVRF
jgi:hypothetical protein